MSLDNANPTVRKLAATSATAEAIDPAHAEAWLRTAPGMETDESDDDEEPIDADEIYGPSVRLDSLPV